MRLLKSIFRKEDKGVAAIEFAILAPLLVLTVFGLIEVSNYVFCVNKMNRTAQGVGNIVSRGDVSKPQMDAMLISAAEISQPFDFNKHGCVIVSSISQPNNNATLPAKLNWTDSYPSAGCGTSRINVASLPGGLSLGTNDTIITTEVFFNYQPFFPSYKYNNSPLIAAAKLLIYAYSVTVPRQGSMSTLPPS